MKYKILLVLNFLFTASIGSGFIYYYRETQREIKRLDIREKRLNGMVSALHEMNKSNAKMIEELITGNTSNAKMIEELITGNTKLEGMQGMLGYQSEQLIYLQKLRANVADISLYEGVCEVHKISRNAMETMANQLAKNTCMINMLKKTLKNSFKD